MLDHMILQNGNFCCLNQVLAYSQPPTELLILISFLCRLSYPQLNHHQKLYPSKSSWQNANLCLSHGVILWSWIQCAGGDPGNFAQVCILCPGFCTLTCQTDLRHRQTVLTFTLIPLYLPLSLPILFLLGTRKSTVHDALV